MMKKRVKRGSAVLIALALMCSVLTLPEAKAAVAVKPEEKCSIEFSISATKFEELDDIPIEINLYKVATIDETGAYTATEGFEDLDLSSVEYDENASAETWLTRAEEASALITEDMVVAREVTVTGGTATEAGLDTGLYLVKAEDALSDYYKYSFKPYLISLPNNYYYPDGNSDEWVYDLTGANAIGLKPEQEERLGNLKITKNLENQNVTMGEKATFVFEVTYTTPKDKENPKTDYVTLTFDKYGDKTALIENIPAGSKVTVTEVYSGASYELVSEKEVSTEIAAGEEASVEFTNTHDGRPNGGYGVVNHYTREEGTWDGDEITDSTATKK